MLHHDVYEFFKRSFGQRIPAQLLLGFGGVAPEIDHVGGTIEVGRHLDEHFARFLVDAFLFHAFAFKLQFDAGSLESVITELTHRMLFAGGDDEVFGAFVLKDEPHALHVVLGIAPVAQRGEVAQVELVLLASGDAGGSEGDFACHEGFAAALTFVVEEDARTAEHAIGFAVLLDNPETIKFGHSIRAVRVEWGVLVLRHFLHLSVKFRGRGLIDAAGVGQATHTHGLQHAEYSHSIDISRKFGSVERNLNVALCCEVVNLIGVHLGNDLQDGHRVAHVAIMKVELWAAFEVGDALAIVH